MSGGSARASGSANHKNLSSFFKRSPQDWSITEYLGYSHPADLSPRKILDGWRKGLVVVTRCDNRSCCTEKHRERAADLIRRFEETGNGSDRRYGQLWLQDAETSSSSSKKRKTTSAPAPDIAHTINFGHIYNASGDHTVLNQPSNAGTATFAQGASADDVTPPSLPPTSPSPAIESSLEAPEEIFPEDSRSAFRKTYGMMKQHLKWRLASGRYVEDIIFDACHLMTDEDFSISPAQSFILNVTADEGAKSWFKDEEWAEVRGSVPKLPDADPVFVESMRRFLKLSSTDELERVLETTSYRKPDTEYTPEVHWNSRWADTVMRIMLNLYAAPGSPLRTSHLEDWYSSHLWATIIDQCLLSLRGMKVERKESTCRATAERKNRHRTKTGGKNNRAKVGPRLDAIIRSAADNSYEYGGVEVGRSFGGTSATKWLEDGWKLCKALRDMLYRLHELVEHDPETTSRLQVVGVINAGLQLQCIRMSHPRGYVCLLQKERLQTVPQEVDDLGKLFRLLVCVTQVKEMIQDCMQVVKDRQKEKSEDELLKELLDEPERVERTLFWAHDSP